ncbi:hypothetical protein SAMD00019534_035660 [Acytostelium subglobosum LB1]|uniref:hypothetical protein n=1 Tax=Acytostelium subglobosum LB1 TaxID=1410327 RepID=UPI000644C90F|nr:hypothetical protein SAMD00019534_035660 [Acytostelium subglobosum LB1]GAM20391.1 hypothetical protein SAMD00019534_035660 [Acytostelium subglobosum LB1]|eukprot:XP_012759912.1 hypothetical protein SAMD00019534_035660 [Acytostelium subglobosum LB1]
MTIDRTSDIDSLLERCETGSRLIPFAFPIISLRFTRSWKDGSLFPLEAHRITYQNLLNQLESYSGDINFPEVINSKLPSTLRHLELMIFISYGEDNDEDEYSPSKILAPLIRLSNDYPHLESLSLHFEMDVDSIVDYFEHMDNQYLAALNHPSHPYSIICRSFLNSTLTSLRSLTLADSVAGEYTFTTHMYSAPRLFFESILHFAPSLQRLSLRMCNDASDFGEHLLFYTELKHYLEKATTLKCLVLPEMLAGEPQELVKYLVQDASIEIEGEIQMQNMVPITRPLQSLSIRCEGHYRPPVNNIYESLNMVKHLQVTPYDQSDYDFIPHIGSETTLTLTTVVYCDRLCQLLAENHRITTLYINPRAEGYKYNKEKFQAIIDVHPSIKNKDSVFVDAWY